MNIREATINDANSIANINISSWRVTYNGIMTDDFLNNMSIERNKKSWFKTISDSNKSHFIYVAEDRNKNVIGFILGGKERSGNEKYKGEIYAVYIKNNFHRKGIGRQLVLTLIERLINENILTLLVWVLEENPACLFYKALGGKDISKKEIEIGGKKLIEVAFGWQDIHTIVNSYSKNTT